MDKKTKVQRLEEFKREHRFEFKYLKIYSVLIFLIFFFTTYLIKKPSKYMVALFAIIFLF